MIYSHKGELIENVVNSKGQMKKAKISCKEFVF